MFECERESVDARTFDISEQGLYVRSTRHPKVGDQFRAQFSLPGGNPITCELRVVWINDYNLPAALFNRPPGFGAIFSRISEDDQRAIALAIEKKLI